MLLDKEETKPQVITISNYIKNCIEKQLQIVLAVANCLLYQPKGPMVNCTQTKVSGLTFQKQWT